MIKKLEEEFLNSIPLGFKLVKKEKSLDHNDVQNQYIELVDILHFSLSYMLLDQDIDEIVHSNGQLLDTRVDDDIMGGLISFYDTGSLTHMYAFLGAIITHFNLDEAKLLEIYYEKNKLNAHRIENGYMEGTYSKHDADGNEDNRLIAV